MVLCFIPRDSRGDTTNGRPKKSILDCKSHFSVFGFRFSPFRFPGLGPTQGPWPVRASCVETCAQFAFHRPCTPRHARVRAHGNVFGPR